MPKSWFESKFNLPNWILILKIGLIQVNTGPFLLTDTIMTFCGVGRGTNRSIIGHHFDCGDFSVLNYTVFYPLKSPQRWTLFEQHNDKFWKEVFKDALSVHFFGSNTSGRRWTNDLFLYDNSLFHRGWRTGNHTAYDFLGKRFCPKSYGKQNNMNLWLKWIRNWDKVSQSSNQH